RPVEAAVLAPARGEVELLDDAAVGVVQQGAQDRGVRQVLLLGAREVLQLDRPVAAVLRRFEQGAERRIAVERGQATPHHAPARVDQRAEAAVADQAQGEIVHALPPDASQRRTARGLRRPKCAALGSRSPTSTLMPSRAFTTAKPLSSVMSSPANTGTRPRNGGSSSIASIALPLSPAAGRSSTTWWPCCRR